MPHNYYRASWISGILLLGLSLLTGCGGGGNGSSSNPPPSPPPAASSAVQVKIGDAPADRVISFEVSVGPITLTPSSGSAVTVLSAARRLEMTHLSGTNEPLALLDVPQGNYTSATLTVANPEVVFINNQGTVVKLEPAFNQQITVNFNPALAVNAAAAVLNIDLNVASSLSFDAQGNVNGVNLSASSFLFSTAAVAAEDNQHAEDGELEDLSGKVTGVSGSSFTLDANGTSLTFATDANTEFNDGASLSTMLNTIVTVEGRTRSDGSLYAKEVEGVENENGAEAEGLILQVSGNPATQLTLAVDDGAGSGMDDSKVGTTLTVDISGAGYKVSKGNIDTSGIGGLPAPPNFPFDASTIHAAQRVEADTDSPLSGNSIVADKVKLKQQTLAGTVSGLSGTAPTTFTLNLAPDSAFAMLSGASSVTVYWQAGTELHGISGVQNGDLVRVRGLVFFTGTAFNMIARRIGE